MTDPVLESIREDIKEIKKSQHDLFKILNGNGKIGVITRVELNRASLRRAWVTIWTLATGLFGMAIK